MVKRLFNPLITSSFFLFGARGTGKSTVIKERFSEDSLYLDLLDPVLEDRLVRHPEDLKVLIGRRKSGWVIIDEVQKAPRLLDVVHSIIESTKIKFILTGSSARKLKRGGANLLAGRAYVYNLFPFVSSELTSEFSLEETLQFGALPKVILADTEREKKTYLQAYALTYIKEEVIAEQLLRKLEPFRNFLRIAADQSGKLINHSALAKQVGVDHKTVVNYFSTLEDTLLGFYLPSFHLSVRKSQTVAPKFFFFDLGVRNSLAEMIDTAPTPRSSYFGDLFEYFLILECFRHNSYSEKGYRLSFFRTKSGFEVDLVLSKGKKNIFIEVKSSSRIDLDEVKHISHHLADLPEVSEIFYVSQDPSEITEFGVRCLGWKSFLKLIF
jgi:predicted AAA+ superfamily ATPase